jgi:hypothetical protein
LKLKLERRIIMKKIYGVITLVAMLMGATLFVGPGSKSKAGRDGQPFPGWKVAAFIDPS